MHIPLGTLEFSDGVEFGFPNYLCCNCATKQELRVIEQDTRRTTYLGGGGTETTFALPLPFCARCAPSARRRPKGIFSRLLMLALAYAVWFGLLIMAGEFGIAPPILAQYLLPAAGVLAVLTILAMMLVATPKSGQTSYYQPVRIPILKRKFVTGEVTAIGFFFTCRAYAKAFQKANQEAISRRQLIVKAR